jgi:hypothetical protein
MGAFFAFALSPIGRLLITAALMFSLGGRRLARREGFSDARWFKAQSRPRRIDDRTLQARIKVANAATIEDQQRAAAAESKRVGRRGKGKRCRSSLRTLLLLTLLTLTAA